MAEKLRDYRRKRDFKATPEPSGGESEGAPRARFVIQEHHARRLHWDPPADPGAEPMPERIVPMMAKLAELPRDEERYAFEIKWDGIRAILYYEPGRMRIEGRRLTDVTSRYPELRPLGRQLGSRSAVL